MTKTDDEIETMNPAETEAALRANVERDRRCKVVVLHQGPSRCVCADGPCCCGRKPDVDMWRCTLADGHGGPHAMDDPPEGYTYLTLTDLAGFEAMRASDEEDGMCGV